MLSAEWCWDTMLAMEHNNAMAQHHVTQWHGSTAQWWLLLANIPWQVAMIQLSGSCCGDPHLEAKMWWDEIVWDGVRGWLNEMEKLPNEVYSRKGRSGRVQGNLNQNQRMITRMSHQIATQIHAWQIGGTRAEGISQSHSVRHSTHRQEYRPGQECHHSQQLIIQ